MIYKNLLDLIGNTPIIEYKGVFIKLEQFNLACSIKDRVALEMIKQLEIKKQIHENSTVIEVTSGNTGIAIAMICAIKRYKCIIIMPNDVSNNKVNLIKAYGGEVILFPSTLGIKHGIEIAKRLEKDKGYIFLNQFVNEDNPSAHQTTAKEIINNFNHVDYFVCGIGTGGTIYGIGNILKKKYPNIKIIGVMPKNSDGKICGIAASTEVSFYEPSLIDQIYYVDWEEVSLEFSSLAKEGMLIGFSSVANYIVSRRIKEENQEKIVLMISADSGTKYIDSCDLNV